MSFKKTLATLVLAGSLALGGDALAQEPIVERLCPPSAEREVSYSKRGISFLEPIKCEEDGEITNFEYITDADGAYFSLISDENPILGKNTKIRVIAMDNNIDGKIDWIRIERYRFSADLPDGEKAYEEIRFYRGQEELELMLKTPGVDLERLRGKTIPEQEMGVVTAYDSSPSGVTFTPNKSPVIIKAFEIIDRMYADIHPSVTGNLKDKAGVNTTIPDISEKYKAEIQTLLNTQPKL